MEAQYYREMMDNLTVMEEKKLLEGKHIYLFGHCNATEELAKILHQKGYKVIAILDNNQQKQGEKCYGIPILAPKAVLNEKTENTLVCIVTRFYEAMYMQLRQLGFTGEVKKLVDYNTYAEYSLSTETIKRKKERLCQGIQSIEKLKKNYPESFRIFCPFSALGDIYFCMSYLPYFLEKRGKKNYVICVSSRACAKVVALFDSCPIEIMEQKNLDAAVQAELYIQDKESFIAHQDRPYVVNLFRALYRKKIPLEQIYCCGVFGLMAGIKPALPRHWNSYRNLHEIVKHRSVIFSPYAKSVTALPMHLWNTIIEEYQSQGYCLFTNVVGDEEPLPQTLPISPDIGEMKSVVEWAGVFIGIRSGLCDVIRTADCKKIALYPDYYYCDTKWKAIDMYFIDGFENIVVGDDFVWEKR